MAAGKHSEHRAERLLGEIGIAPQNAEYARIVRFEIEGAKPRGRRLPAFTVRSCSEFYNVEISKCVPFHWPWA